MTTGHLHPADAKALSDLWEDVQVEVADISPGRAITIIIARDREGRISPGGSYIERRKYPLEDPA